MKLIIPPVAQVLLGLLAIWGLAIFSPFAPLGWSALIAAGAVLAAAGLAIIIVAVGLFAKASTTVDPRDPSKGDALVTRGLYRFTRNPMYLGMAMILFAAALSTGQVITLVIPVAFLVYMTRYQIIPEETFLRSRYGRTFDDYASRVRRWI